jgi:hypothetical protein
MIELVPISGSRNYLYRFVFCLRPQVKILLWQTSVSIFGQGAYSAGFLSPSSGKNLTLLGLVSVLRGKTYSVGFSPFSHVKLIFLDLCFRPQLKILFFFFQAIELVPMSGYRDQLYQLVFT